MRRDSATATATTEKLRPSRYNHLVGPDTPAGSSGPNGEGGLGFQGRTGALVELDEKAYRALQDPGDLDLETPETEARPSLGPPNGDAIGDLREAGFLVPADRDEFLDLRRLYYRSNYGTAVLNVVLAPTLACNMACRYCFETGREASRMTPEIVAGTLRRVGEGLEDFKVLRVTWYGGEPLLALDTVERLTEGLRSTADRVGCTYEAHLVSNGTLLTARTAERLKDLGVRTAQVTLDGPSSLHDTRRRLHGGAPTWARIAENLPAAARSLEIVVRATLAPGEASQLLPLCEALDKAEIPPSTTVRPAPLSPSPGCASGECSADFLPAELLTAGLYDENRDHPRLRLPDPDVRAGCLASSAWSFAVDAAGDIHRCLETVGDPAWAAGNVLTAGGHTDPRPYRDPWLRADPFLSGECAACTYLPQCFGGCPKAFLDTGRRRCTPWKEGLEDWIRAAAGAPYARSSG